ncbi:MAG: ABC transporter ATP-binding protein [Alphaproteobacteria bacterium]
MAHIVAMEGIKKQYEPSPGIITPVLKSLDLLIEQGEFVSIMGPSGSGKSTLMNILGALDLATEGTYLLDGINVGRLSDAELAQVRNRVIGFVFQGFNLLPRRTVVDNIALPLLYADESHDERIKRAEHYLNVVGLSSHRDYYPTQLSGGQQQRIAIARALAGEPKIIMADEPTGNLDSATTKDIMKLFDDLNKEGISIILVTHEQDVAEYGKRLVQIKDGEIVYDGPMY